MKTLLSTLLAVACMPAGILYAQQQGALGVTMSDNSTGGVLITNVIANSPAARIGLRSGDRILAVNDQPTVNYRDVMRIIGASQPNAPVKLTMVRGAWRGTLTAELASAASVFNADRQFVQPNQFAPASTQAPMYYANPRGFGGFPREWIDNGNRGVAASYGGGGW